MQVCIRTKQQKTENNKTHVETHVQNLHAAQAISRTPNQRVNRKTWSPLQKILIRLWKLNIDRKLITFVEVNHIQGPFSAETQFFNV